MLLLLEAALLVGFPAPVIWSLLGVLPVVAASSDFTESVNARMIAFFAIASFRAFWMFVLSSSVHAEMVNVGALHFVTTVDNAGVFVMEVVQVVMVVTMVEQACSCLLPRSLA